MPSESEPQNRPWLKSTKVSEVAVGLSDDWLKVVKNQNSTLEERLRKLRNAVWDLNDEGKPRIVPQTAEDRSKRMQEKEGVFADVLQGLTPKEKSELLESYARLGHIYEIAGLVARENYFEDCRKKGNSIPGGVKEFLETQGGTSLEDVMTHIQTPVFEVVMTQHPTNVNSLAFMKAQRAVAIELEKMNKGKDANTASAGFIEALNAFQKAPIIKTEGEGVAKKTSNLTVREEIDTVVNFLENIYDDVPRVYAQYDRQLEEKFPQYKPEELKLNMRFGSWGSAGDKDGNTNITAFNTLEGIALHTQAILKKYDAELAGLPELKTWNEAIHKALEAVTNITEHITTIRKRQDELMHGKEAVSARESEALNHAFDSYSHALADIRHKLNDKKGEFEDAIQVVYEGKKNGNDEDKKHAEKALNLLRRVRTFGFTFAKIEYRETAEAYAKVVADILGESAEYEKLSPQEKEYYLTKKLLKPELADVQEKVATILKTGAGKNYSAKDPLAISYTTLKRMQLAREHSDMIKDNVLAECGKMSDKDADLARLDELLKLGKKADQAALADQQKIVSAKVAAQGTANILEAQFLQNVVADAHGNKPLMGIVPLFEEPETMSNIEKIMESAYGNPAYKQHMQAVADTFHGGIKTQQVQIAHSDNARRSGLQAARGFIHEAHQKIEKLNKAQGIKTEFFEGGSMSDAYRNGLRCPSATVNAFDLHDFAKFTFQGGDLLNYFNVPCAMERLFTRNLSNQSMGLSPHQKDVDKFDDDPVINDVAITALKATLHDYETKDFTADKMGMLLAALDYDAETKAGNSTSRAAKRSETVFGKVTDIFVHVVNVGINVVNTLLENVQELTGVPIDKIRTIAYSESSQHAGLVLSWVGSDHLLEHIAKAIVDKKNAIESTPSEPSEAKFLEIFEGVTEDPRSIHAEHIRALYEGSPAFRDAQDRAAFAVAMTNMDRVEKTVEHNLKQYFDTPREQYSIQAKQIHQRDPKSVTRDELRERIRAGTARDIGENNAERKAGIREYIATLKTTFKKASWVAAAAHDKNVAIALHTNHLRFDSIAQVGDNQPPKYEKVKYEQELADTYNRFEQEAWLTPDKMRDASAMVAERLELMTAEIAQKRGYRSFGIHVKAENNMDDYQRRLVHNAVDTVVHGRWGVGDIKSAGAMKKHNDALSKGNASAISI